MVDADHSKRSALGSLALRIHVSSTEIAACVAHIRELYRQAEPANEQEQDMRKRRERKIKDFLSNLPRTSGRPTLSMLHAMAEACSLTVDGVHRLFGYELDGLREFDFRLNHDRTHIVESYVFERDLNIELPLVLAPVPAFQRTADLNTLVPAWQRNIPIRALDRSGWRRPGTFYVRVGTQDGRGSSIPAGSLALVEPVEAEESSRPNPRFIYLLQFHDGYRCSRCVVTSGRLQLLASDHSYDGPHLFSHPSSVRVVGRIRAAATALPLPEAATIGQRPNPDGSAPLVLPWEHPTLARILATKHRRFVRSEEQKRYVDDVLETWLESKISERTERRYRHTSVTQPHADTLMQMAVAQYARYTDLLRAAGLHFRDKQRFSLRDMLRTNSIEDLLSSPVKAPVLPSPLEVWEARRREFVEWPALLSLKFPRPSLYGERIVRVAEEIPFSDEQIQLKSGSWLLTEEMAEVPDLRSDASKRGWSRPLYVFRSKQELQIGHLEPSENGLTLVAGHDRQHIQTSIAHEDLRNLRRVSGALIPVTS